MLVRPSAWYSSSHWHGRRPGKLTRHFAVRSSRTSSATAVHGRPCRAPAPADRVDRSSRCPRPARAPPGGPQKMPTKKPARENRRRMRTAGRREWKGARIDRGFFVARCGPLGHTPARIEPPKPFRAQVWSPRKCARLSWPVRPAERTRGLPIRGVEILPDMASAAGPSRTVRVDRDGARRRRCGPAGRCAASVQPAGRRASASLRSGGRRPPPPPLT